MKITIWDDIAILLIFILFWVAVIYGILAVDCNCWLF